MGNLIKYYNEYKNFGSSTDTAGDTTTLDYPYPLPGDLVPYDYWYPRPCHWYPPENKTEQAFKILKLLVEEKVIKEPSSFKKFCEIIEKLAGVI